MWSQTIFHPDKNLLARAAQRDAAAFGLLYECYRQPILRYVLYRVTDMAEAEDLTELVFLKAWEALEHYQAGAVPFGAWLYRIAHNVVVDRHRTYRELVPLDGQLAAPAEEGPEEQLARRERLKTLKEAVAQLPPVYRQVLTLRFVRGLSHAETARVLRRSNDAVRVLQHRALRALRAALQPTMLSGVRFEISHVPTDHSLVK